MLFEGGWEGDRCTNLIRKSIPNSGGFKSKTLSKLFDRFINWGLELWRSRGESKDNVKDITDRLIVTRKGGVLKCPILR